MVGLLNLPMLFGSLNCQRCTGRNFRHLMGQPDAVLTGKRPLSQLCHFVDTACVSSMTALQQSDHLLRDDLTP